MELLFIFLEAPILRALFIKITSTSYVPFPYSDVVRKLDLNKVAVIRQHAGGRLETYTVA